MGKTADSGQPPDSASLDPFDHRSLKAGKNAQCLERCRKDDEYFGWPCSSATDTS